MILYNLGYFTSYFDVRTHPNVSPYLAGYGLATACDQLQSGSLAGVGTAETLSHFMLNPRFFEGHQAQKSYVQFMYCIYIYILYIYDDQLAK